MEEHNATQTLNSTFIPNTLIKNKKIIGSNIILTKTSFQKVAGNMHLSIDPPQLRFQGCDVDRTYTQNVRVINEAPVPQRVQILPPESSAFSIKTAKKGLIPTGMSEEIKVSYRSSEDAHQHDAIRISTEIDSLLIPLDAYPAIPSLEKVFPKLIDFGGVVVGESETNKYYVANSSGAQFEFEFLYHKDSPQIMIVPLKGMIKSMSTLIVQISFKPLHQITSTAQVDFIVKQFRLKPITIRIIGNGREKIQSTKKLPKRMLSSKLRPIETKQNAMRQTMKTREREAQVQDKQQEIAKSGRVQLMKSLAQKREKIIESMNVGKMELKDYLSRYSQVQQLDKQKDITLSQSLGDTLMEQEEIDFELHLNLQTNKARHAALQHNCKQRYSCQKDNFAAINYAEFVSRNTSQLVTYDDRKNDELKRRRKRLQCIMNMLTKLIIKQRMLKRLAKIKAFLGGHNKEEVAKMVHNDCLRALDSGPSNHKALNTQELGFSSSQIQPSFLVLQHAGATSQKSLQLLQITPQTGFDDLVQHPELSPHQLDILNFSVANYPPGYAGLSKHVPEMRRGDQQEYGIKSETVPGYEWFEPSTVFQKPINIKQHHFIYQGNESRQYKHSEHKNLVEHILGGEKEGGNQYEGWEKGEYELLKAKFMRNHGCEMTAFHEYSFPINRKYQLAPPTLIEDRQPDDIIAEGDSDEEKQLTFPLQKLEELLLSVEAKDKNASQLRTNMAAKLKSNPRNETLSKVEQNLTFLNCKAVGAFAGKIAEYSRYANQSKNNLLI